MDAPLLPSRIKYGIQITPNGTMLSFGVSWSAEWLVEVEQRKGCEKFAKIGFRDQE